MLLQDHRTTNKSVCKQPEHSKQFMQWSVTVCNQAAGNDDRNKDDFNSQLNLISTYCIFTTMTQHVV